MHLSDVQCDPAWLGCCESSSIGHSNGLLWQDFQFCLVSDSGLLIEIQEFRVKWPHGTNRILIRLIGFKNIFLSNNNFSSIQQGHDFIKFAAIFDKDDDVIGTQILNEGCRMQFLNFRPTECSLRGELASSAYRKYYCESDTL